MPLTIESRKVMRFPSASRTASAESVEVVFRLVTNKAAPGLAVIDAAINEADPAKRLPPLNATFDIEFGGVQHSYPNLYAARYSHEEYFQRERLATVHDITLTYETVQAGSASAPRTSNPNLNVNPLERQPRIERTVEWLQKEELITEARNVKAITGLVDREADKLGPIINAAGDPIEVTESVRYPVLVARKNVSSYEKAVAMEINWRRTTNGSTWRDHIGKGKAAFLSADVDGPLYWNDLTYYKLTVRVLWSDKEIRLRLPNVGPNVNRFDLDAGVQVKVPAVKKGLLLPAANLNQSGEMVDTASTIDYDHLTPKNYATLDTEIDNYD